MTRRHISISKISNDFGANKTVVRNKTDDNRIYYEEKNKRKQLMRQTATGDEKIDKKIPTSPETTEKLGHIEKKARKKLKAWEEVVGTVNSVDENTVYFDNIGGVLIGDELFLKKTKEFVGKKIAILRTDLIYRPYIVKNMEVMQ